MKTDVRLNTPIHKGRVQTEEKAKVVASVWGAKFIQFVFALAVLLRKILNNRMNCIRMIWKRIVLGKLASTARNWINSTSGWKIWRIINFEPPTPIIFVAEHCHGGVGVVVDALSLITVPQIYGTKICRILAVTLQKLSRIVACCMSQIS